MAEKLQKHHQSQSDIHSKPAGVTRIFDHYAPKSLKNGVLPTSQELVDEDRVRGTFVFTEADILNTPMLGLDESTVKLEKRLTQNLGNLSKNDSLIDDLINEAL